MKQLNKLVVGYYPHFFLLFAALMIRFMTLGNPILEWDEEFYLFGGGRLLQGHLPYVDFWDRKPIGLFLLYAVFHLFGACRVIAYQIGALLALWGTALLIRRMALRIAPASGAMVAALIYEIWPTLAQGEGGQSPIFYNLLVAGAMCLLLDHLQDFEGNDRKRRRTLGILIMLLFGVAIQIKYTVVFEGMFAGLYLIYREIRSGSAPRSIVADSAIWVFVAVLPTIASALFYIMSGYGHEWLFSNISSVFLRATESHQIISERLIKLLPLLGPFFIVMGVNFLSRRSYSAKQTPYVSFLTMWAMVAFSAFVIFGTWYIHYILPLLVPFSIQIAPLFYRKSGRNLAWLMAILGLVASQLSTWKHLRSSGGKELFLALEKSVDYGKSGCLFIYNGPVALYDALPYCRLTSHPFPSHFGLQREAGATGMDPLAELHAVLTQEPAYIISQEPEAAGENRNVRKALYDALSRDYVRTYSWISRPHRRMLSVYKRSRGVLPPHPALAPVPQSE